METIREFWSAVRETESTLPQDPFVMSIESRTAGIRGGVVAQAGREAAAKLIVTGSHRLATAEEIEAYHAGEAETRRNAYAAAEHAAGRVSVVVSPEPRKKAR
jgi:hypothetical protein